jgi:GT2 family glycosyltransferase
MTGKRLYQRVSRGPATFSPSLRLPDVRASVVIVSYNSGPALVRCLDSLLAEGGENEVIVVNNGSPAPEIEQAAAMPGVRVVEPGENLGYAGGSSLGAREATGDVLVFLNPDTTVAPGTIGELVRALEDESVAIAMGRLLLMDDPGLLNAAGCAIHLSGLAWSAGFGEPAASIATTREITYANGSALAIRADRFRELGGFTDKLFIYHEDLELGWKARMRGYRIVIAPQADVLHEYDYGRHASKNYFMERNRLIFVASAYSARLLVVLAPVLITTELGLVALAWRQGWLRDKVAGWRWILKNAGWLKRHRRELQKARTVPDRELAEHLTAVIDPKMIEVPRAVARANGLVAAYWRVARRLL